MFKDENWVVHHNNGVGRVRCDGEKRRKRGRAGWTISAERRVIVEIKQSGGATERTENMESRGMMNFFMSLVNVVVIVAWNWKCRRFQE
jgi:hypothetical protein